MPSPSATLLAQYLYDPLDRLIGCAPSGVAAIQTFYQGSRLASELQGDEQRTVMQHGDQVLAQYQRREGADTALLLATDQQRSVLQMLGAEGGRRMAYTPYGHRPAEIGLGSLLGFNGERPDPVTGYYLLGNGYRVFNPVLMCFHSPDSLSPFEGGGLNIYMYCEGDPINFCDPSGHAKFFMMTGRGYEKYSSRFLQRVQKGRAPSVSASSSRGQNAPPSLETLLSRPVEGYKELHLTGISDTARQSAQKFELATARQKKIEQRYGFHRVPKSSQTYHKGEGASRVTTTEPFDETLKFYSAKLDYLQSGGTGFSMKKIRSDVWEVNRKIKKIKEEKSRYKVNFNLQ